MRLRRCSRRSIWLEMFTLSMRLQGYFPPKVAPFKERGNYEVARTRAMRPAVERLDAIQGP